MKQFSTIKKALIHSLKNDGEYAKFEHGKVGFIAGTLWLWWDWDYKGNIITGEDDIVIDLSKWE